MHSFPFRLAVVLLVFSPAFVQGSSLAPVRATITGDAARFFPRELTRDDFTVDAKNKYVRGTVKYESEEGEVSITITGTVNEKTGGISATLSGAHDWNYAADKKDRQTSYLRTVFDGTWQGSLSSHVVKTAPYVWEGPIAVVHLVVMDRFAPTDVAIPREKFRYAGAMTLVVEPEFVSGFEAGASSAEPIVTQNVAVATSSVTVPSVAISAAMGASGSVSDGQGTATTTAAGVETNVGRKIILGIVVVLGVILIVSLAFSRKIE